ncbi:tetratricopeptide (TPR) repeat protein [Actinoalloteichus hoggarensis]|uniref:Uncharacterized protein n=1 Tax=Actinoalloteichus hoggarensis TaxID=1470176 RepID=A0A221WBK5_9PSEU|nr:hypothetical protein [Actinoalloteichus hoggarensis]ASO22956.1 hypothetical protein AHOG_26785 [Actinoalloteichus hoggarensis]MBB5922559.1 tetratricopeptide (TPR) repeat protein [Actinoalloteichus hoggarensis]
MSEAPRDHPPRTLLGELIRQRGQTAEQFSEAAERFAREHGIDATLSVRHVQRLASGHRADGRPLGRLRPVTRRLLEEMFGVPVDRLLQPAPVEPGRNTATADVVYELRARIAAGRTVDTDTVALLRRRLDITRVLDRRLGGTTLLGELRGQIEQLERLLSDVLREPTRSELAALLVDASTLAAWQSLDQGETGQAWTHYNRARAAAREAESRSLEAYASASQAVVLLDIGETADAVELTDHARRIATGKATRLLAAWLAAGHGEALAAGGDDAKSLELFDTASDALRAEEDPAETPYLVFDATHLARWRGSALARLGHHEAYGVLSAALDRLDPSFIRAETALRVDLTHVHALYGEWDVAAAHRERARLLAQQIGSVRQQSRLGYSRNNRTAEAEVRIT